MTALLYACGLSAHGGHQHGNHATDLEHDACLGIEAVSLTLERGQIGALLGGPHAGKSLLLDVLAGIVECETGEIKLNGLPLQHQPVWSRRQAGLALASQHPPRFDSLTAEEQICLGLRRQQLPAALRQFLLSHIPELAPLFPTRMHELSRQAQRLVDLAACLASLPAVMLIDDLAIDLGTERTIKLTQNLRDADVTILLADRYAVPMLSIADCGWLIVDGRIVMEGSGEQLRQDDRIEPICMGTSSWQDL